MFSRVPVDFELSLIVDGVQKCETSVSRFRNVYRLLSPGRSHKTNNYIRYIEVKEIFAVVK